MGRSKEMSDIERLISSIETHVPKGVYEFIGRDPRPGSNIKIHWCVPVDGVGEDAWADHAYLFELPGYPDDLIVHCQFPQSMGGKDISDPEWIYLYNLCDNEFVECIEVLD